MTEEIVVKEEGLEILKAKSSAADIDVLISKLLAAETLLDNGYAKLGYLLVEVHDKKHWQHIGYKSFGEYIKELSTKYNRGRSQLYHYFSTVRELAPYVTEDQLNDMGIAKASELSKSAKRTGFPISPQVIDEAVKSNTTASTLRKLLFEEDNVVEPEKGTWLDQQGFYVDDNERLVISSADESALRTDPAVQNDVPDWVKRKEARLRQAMNYLADH